MSEDRLTNLEIKFLYQEKIVEELQQIVHEQYLTIKNLEKAIELLKDQVVAGQDSRKIPNEKPPHY